MTAAFRAFREPYLISLPTTVDGDFGDWEARKLRYALYWAFFENTAYRNIQSWARTYKRDFGLYRYIRHIYNPTYRLGVFWQTHLWGGQLDPEAGDGQGEPSALPIQVGETADEERLRAAIAQLWVNSNWSVKKDVLTLQGSMKGDIGLEVVDDPLREKVYLRIVQPDVVKSVNLDDFGHVKGYVFELERDDPERPGRDVTYTEEVTRDGDLVVYRTYRNNSLYDWTDTDDGRGAEWDVPYGFVPFVMLQHNDVGLDWGWSELHAGRGKFGEADDLASKLSDQVRKSVDSPWLFSGVDKPGSTPRTTSRDNETYQATSSAADRPQPGREEVPALYGPAEAKATPLVAPLDVSATVEYIQSLLEEIERDFPELRADIYTASGDASGRALRVARQQAESKVRMRREGYDQALVRAQQMAVAIGGMRGYFEGYNLESYEAGALDHSIGKRPVFAQDPMDDIEIEYEFWRAAEQAQKVGVSLPAFLGRQGMTEAQIAEFMEEIEAAPETQARRAQQQLAIEAVRLEGSQSNG